MPEPRTGADLQQFVCAAGWMRNGIPEFNVLTASLNSFLEKVYQEAKGRTKTKASRVLLDKLGWGPEESKCFLHVKEALKNQCMLSHVDQSKTLCLFTDASNTHWGAVLTQIPPEDKDKDVDKQRHEPLSFLSGTFSGSSRDWSTPEKEAFAIVESLLRLDYYLLNPDGFLLFTDHKNLTFIYNPLSVNGSIAKHVLSKIQRWAMTISSFMFEIVHIAGDDNVWADLLSRWGAPKTEPKRPQLNALFRAPLAPSLDPDYKWPSAQDVLAAQQELKDSEDCSKLSVNSDGLLSNTAGLVWVPKHAQLLQIRITIVGHCGIGGHRGAGTTYEAIKEVFFWQNMRSDISVFCNTCLHCQLTLGGLRVPRPLGHALHATKPNELLHFDFLFMDEGDDKNSYCLILKDDASSFVWLEPCEAANSEAAASTLLKWFSLFGTVRQWVSDQGPHFKNKLMETLNRSLRAHHHFTTPYTPQANGTVEHVCQEVLRSCRALLSEFRLATTKWTSVIHLIQSILNHSKRPSLGNVAPVTAFTGLPGDNPVRSILAPTRSKVKSLEFIKAQRIINVQSLIKAVDLLHRRVDAARTRKREASILTHNLKTNIQAVNFEIGEFVLVADVLSSSRSKLKVQWKGPQRVIRTVSPFVSTVQDLVSGKETDVHNSRLKFYADSHLGVTEELKNTIDHNSPHYETITKMMDLRYNKQNKQYEVLCKWRGFSHEEPGWEPLPILKEDVPEMLEKFFRTCEKKSLVNAARASLSRRA